MKSEKSEILDIYEITNEEFIEAGVMELSTFESANSFEYKKVFRLDIKYYDGAKGSLYLGYRKYKLEFDTKCVVKVEGKTMQHYDLELYNRIEAFGKKYIDEVLNGVDIKSIIEMDKENILYLNSKEEEKGFIKKLIKLGRTKKETN